MTSPDGGSVVNFDEMLEQIRALVQRQGRVSYRALKRRFDLDDAYLEDLKEAIIHAKQLAVDEGGRVLVWTGDATPPQAAGLLPPARQGTHPPQSGAACTRPRSADRGPVDGGGVLVLPGRVWECPEVLGAGYSPLCS